MAHDTLDDSYDVVVVGAGPAGSTAAYHLGGTRRVLIVDKQAFPRHKACGGALTRCREWPARFPNYAEVEGSLEGHPNERLRLFHDKAPWWDEQGAHLFDQVPRYVLDHRLLQAATRKPGVDFRVFRVRTLEHLDSGMIRLSDGQRILEARAVVGADGAHSMVARALGNPRRTLGTTGACHEIQLVCDKPSESSFVFYLWGGEPGYGWIFCTADGYYVGVGYLGDAARRAKVLLHGLVAWCVEQGILPREHRVARSWGGLAPATVNATLAQGRVLLVGDAAGLLHQLNGEGISYAMRSGQLAGQILSRDLDHPEAAYREAVQPLVREVRYVRTLRPRVFATALSSYLSLSAVAGRVGLGGMVKAPFVERFLGRRR
jgi:menaquinone-9 beta-reductase